MRALRGQFFVRFDLKAQMIDAGLESALRDGEVDARIVQHPFGVVGLLDRGRNAEHRRVEADVGGEIIDGDMYVKAFHGLLLADLRLGCGAQQPPSAVSMTLRHSCGMPWQQFWVRKVISAAIWS